MGRVRTVLVTGAEGQVGRAATAQMEAAGWTVRRFDLTTGQDLRDEGSVRRAVSGCDAVVHAGAIPHDTMGSPADILATNVLGTWHLLLAAEAVGCSRFVYFSSAQVFGFAEGEGTPEYLPVDDEHPLRAARPYGMSKRLAETMCEAWTARTGIPTVGRRRARGVRPRRRCRRRRRQGPVGPAAGAYPPDSLRPGTLRHRRHPAGSRLAAHPVRADRTLMRIKS
jgi:nucleoside-diphosphate-sugar epimerase